MPSFFVLSLYGVHFVDHAIIIQKVVEIPHVVWHLRKACVHLLRFHIVIINL